MYIGEVNSQDSLGSLQYLEVEERERDQQRRDPLRYEVGENQKHRTWYREDVQ